MASPNLTFHNKTLEIHTRKIKISQHIPFELQVEIIIWLPVKSLIQFKSVSKAWKSLIDSSEFIAAHSHSVRNTQPQHLLIRYDDPVTEGNYVSFVNDDTFPQQKFSPTGPPFNELCPGSRIRGSSHGLFCMYGYFRRSGESYLFKEMAILWNPSIRKSIPIAIPIYGTTDVGFGVCPVTCDPKIVQISRVSKWLETDRNISRPRKVNVYTLSSGKWSSLSSNLPRDSIDILSIQEVIGRFIYWCAVDYAHRIAIDGFGVYYLIVSFDMTTEEFIEVELPDTLACQCGFNKFLTISKVSESLVGLEYCLNNEKWQCDVWKMEDGVQKSFTKIFTIKVPHASIDLVLGFRKRGEPIMLIYDDVNVPDAVVNKRVHRQGLDALVVYEPFLEHINDIGIFGLKYPFSVNPYMETLLLLDQSNGQ